LSCFKISLSKPLLIRLTREKRSVKCLITVIFLLLISLSMTVRSHSCFLLTPNDDCVSLSA
jgi:hypothetical protein